MHKDFPSPQKLLFVFLAWLLWVPLCSQNGIRGLITDSTGAGFPFVNVALLNAADSLQLKETMSDEEGNYVFTALKPGTYKLKFFSVGYSECFSENLRIDSTSRLVLPIVKLRSANISLNEISVTAIKKVIEFKNGMTVLNVENSIMASGNTVLDVLKRIPGVTGDNKNNISISGKQGVRIMVDERMQQLAMEQTVSMMSVRFWRAVLYV